MTEKSLEHIIKNLAASFEKARLKKNYSHEKLAKLAGIDRSTVSLILNNKRTPTILTCLKISKALNIKLSKLIAELE